MTTTNEIVTSSFALAQTYANDAKTELASFTQALNNSIYAPPTISATWTSLAEPLMEYPDPPPTLPPIEFAAPTEPAAFAITEPTITIDSFAEIAPTTTFPSAPTASFGAVPTVPSAADVALPTMGALSFPSVPTYLALDIPTFGGVDLHEAWLTKFDTIPTLTLVAPTPYSYAPGAEYASALLTGLKAVLTARLTGGTGLAPAVEQALWDRARSRETQIGLANEAEIMRNSEAMGFMLPTGVLAAQLREAQQAYYDKLSGLSRDISIKQAELEQENLKQTIAAGMDLEGKLIDYSFKLEQLAFESAKTAAENAIQSYNAQVEQYKALLSVYQVYADAYKTIISAELAKVEAYKAQMQAELSKAEVNKALVEQYKATIEAQMSYVEIYKAEIGGAQALVQLEQLKIAAAGEQIKAYVAKVNGFTAEVEGYKAGVDAEVSKLEVYKTKAGVFASTVSAQADVARLELGRYQALAQVKSMEWDGYKAKADAERSRMTALAAQSSALMDGYKASAATIEATAGIKTKVWETKIKDYEAGQQIILQSAKLNNDAMQFSHASLLDASKVGAQVYAQLTSSAYSMIHATAGVTSGATNSVSYQYSNDTIDPPPSKIEML